MRIKIKFVFWGSIVHLNRRTEPPFPRKPRHHACVMELNGVARGLENLAIATNVMVRARSLCSPPLLDDNDNESIALNLNHDGCGNETKRGRSVACVWAWMNMEFKALPNENVLSRVCASDWICQENFPSRINATLC